jgi:hypothetical protein
MTKTLPTVTPEQCRQITGIIRNHAAHTVYTTRILYHGIQNVPVGKCPGRHTVVTVAPPSDPFAGIPGAHDSDL